MVRVTRPPSLTQPIYVLISRPQILHVLKICLEKWKSILALMPSRDLMQHVEVPVPVPKRDQVLVKVEAASVNPVDWKVIQAGVFKLVLPPRLPYIPGAANYSVSLIIRYVHVQAKFVDEMDIEREAT